MADRAAVDAARARIHLAINERVFPGASIDVGSSDGPLWTDALGSLSFAQPAPAVDAGTIYDLASLTKPLATTSLALQLLADKRLILEAPVSSFFPEWLGEDRAAVTIRDLLEHSSGLAARLVDRPPQGRREFEHEICAMRLEYPPRSRSVYSDLDFILLGFLIADVGEATLEEQFAALALRAGLEVLSYSVPEHRRARAAPTLPLEEDVRRGRTLVGEVHDNYAAALGGAAGHAGLFGTAGAVGAFARLTLRAVRRRSDLPPPFTADLVTLATTKSGVPGSSRALGWDTMLPTSSCGPQLSPAAFGHVGFTGTSLWIDPVRDRYFVLLTNRVNGGGTIDQMQAVRRDFHTLASTI